MVVRLPFEDSHNAGCRDRREMTEPRLVGGRGETRKAITATTSPLHPWSWCVAMPSPPGHVIEPLPAPQATAEGPPLAVGECGAVRPCWAGYVRQEDVAPKNSARSWAVVKRTMLVWSKS